MTMMNGGWWGAGALVSVLFWVFLVTGSVWLVLKLGRSVTAAGIAALASGGALVIAVALLALTGTGGMLAAGTGMAPGAMHGATTGMMPGGMPMTMMTSAHMSDASMQSCPGHQGTR